MWVTHHFCINCDKRLNFEQVYYSMGRCPLCGFKSYLACTIVETNERAAKWVVTKPKPWWNPLAKEEGYWLYQKDVEAHADLMSR